LDNTRDHLAGLFADTSGTMHNKDFNLPQIFMITTIKDVVYKVLFTKDLLTEKFDAEANEE